MDVTPAAAHGERQRPVDRPARPAASVTEVPSRVSERYGRLARIVAGCAGHPTRVPRLRAPSRGARARASPCQLTPAGGTLSSRPPLAASPTSLRAGSMTPRTRVPGPRRTQRSRDAEARAQRPGEIERGREPRRRSALPGDPPRSAPSGPQPGPGQRASRPARSRRRPARDRNWPIARRRHQMSRFFTDERVLLDELAARLHLLAHEDREDAVGLDGVLRGHPAAACASPGSSWCATAAPDSFRRGPCSAAPGRSSCRCRAIASSRSFSS